MTIKGVFFCKLYSKVCNSNRELNQTDSCIAQSVHHHGHVALAQNYAWKSSVGQAHLSLLHLFQLQRVVYSSGIGLMPILQELGSCL